MKSFKIVGLLIVASFIFASVSTWAAQPPPNSTNTNILPNTTLSSPTLSSPTPISTADNTIKAQPWQGETDQTDIYARPARPNYVLKYMYDHGRDTNR